MSLPREGATAAACFVLGLATALLAVSFRDLSAGQRLTAGLALVAGALGLAALGRVARGKLAGGPTLQRVTPEAGSQRAELTRVSLTATDLAPPAGGPEDLPQAGGPAAEDVPAPAPASPEAPVEEFELVGRRLPEPEGPAPTRQARGLTAEDVVAAWLHYLDLGDGHFTAAGFARELEARGWAVAVRSGEHLGLPEWVLVVEAEGGDSRSFLVPDFHCLVSTVGDLFDNVGAGSRLARIQRLLQPALGSRCSAGFELEQKGSVE